MRLRFDPWVRKIPWPGEGNDSPLQYPCLGNPTDRGAWRATVRRVAKELDVTEATNNNPTGAAGSYSVIILPAEKTTAKRRGTFDITWNKVQHITSKNLTLWIDMCLLFCILFSFSQHVIHLISDAQLCPTLWPPWTTAHQAPLSITNSRNLLKIMSIKSVMPSNHLILCCPLFLPPSIFPSISVFSNESALRNPFMLYHNDLKYFLKGCLELLVYFPHGSAGKESAYSVGDLGLIPELGRSPGEGNGYPLQYSGLENSMAYSPWGCKELDTTDQL